MEKMTPLWLGWEKDNFWEETAMRIHEARCALLANIMKCDDVICIEEVEAGLHICEAEVVRDHNCRTSDWPEAINADDRTQEALAKFRLQSIPKRKALIDALWEMAGADKIVHTEEIKLISEYADALGVLNYCFSERALNHAKQACA